MLNHFFAEEAKPKRARAYDKQIQMSLFPIEGRAKDFDFLFQPAIDKRQIDELTARRLENAENIVFLGPFCTSKTHLASALVMVAARHRFSTCCVSCHTS